MSGTVARLLDSDIADSFRKSPNAVVSAIVALICILGAALAPWIAPHDPFDLASLSLMDSFKPPIFAADGEWSFMLGSDDQGRDVLSGILYGARISLIVGFCSVALGMVIGIAAGLVSGYLGGFVDATLMRIADIQLTFPAIMVALLIDGIVRVVLPRNLQDAIEIYVLIAAIGISFWPQFARIVRGSTLVERNKDYVLAAKLIGISPVRILFSHILPNVIGPVLVVATLSLGLAIITEASLSFLGLGLPPTKPSLGTLIRIGNAFLFSGEWWVTIFPGAALVVMVLSINLLGDWLRDALNPRLR